MPDRYGETDPVVDFDSRRQARETAAAAEAARQRRQSLAESRAVHAPLSRDQSDAARRHRNDVTTHAEAAREAMRIVNCGMCDDDGYRGLVLCDHVDRILTATNGMARVRAAMGWDTHATEKGQA